MLRKLACAVAVWLMPAAAFAAACNGTALPQGAGYRTANGQIYAPDGKQFVSHGINIPPSSFRPDVLPTVLNQFPGLNTVRIPIFDYENPANYAAAVQAFTSAGIVVVLEHHVGAGGGDFPIPTGGELTQDLAWYQQLGATYGNNPLVWSASTNEPPANNIPALTVWQQQEYQAFRQGGSTAPFGFELENWAYGQMGNGRTDPGSANYNTPTNAYVDTVNTFIDIHAYPWITNTSDAGTIADFWSRAAQAAQARTPSKDGVMPVWFGELGIADSSNAVGGAALLADIQSSGYGYAAWYYAYDGGGDGLLDPGGGLSDYGRLIQGNMTGTSRCPTLPPANPAIKVPYTGGTYESTTLPLIYQPSQADQEDSQRTGTLIDQELIRIQNAPPVQTMDPFTVDGLQIAPTVNQITPEIPEIAPFVPRFRGPSLLDTAPVTQGPPFIAQPINNIAGEIVMLSPIGTLMVHMDGAILTGGDAMIQRVVPANAIFTLMLALFALSQQGLRIVQGETQNVPRLAGLCFKVGVIVFLACNVGNYDKWVRDMFYDTLPAYLMGQTGTPAATGVNAVASQMDHFWALTWMQVAKVWQQAGRWDISSRLSAIICGGTMGVFLTITGLVFEICRLVLMLVLVFGPYALTMALSDHTRPIFERWLGKCVSLVLLQFFTAAVLQITLAGDEFFMTQILPALQQTGGAALGADGGAAPTVASDVQNLVSMLVWFGGSALAVYVLPAVAYSIGGGVMANVTGLVIAGAMAAMKLASMATSGGATSAPLPLPQPEGLSMSLASEGSSGGSGFSLPAVEPPGVESLMPPSP